MALSQTQLNGHGQCTAIYRLPADEGGNDVKIEVEEASPVVELLEVQENDVGGVALPDVRGVKLLDVDVDDDEEVEVLDVEGDDVGGVKPVGVEVNVDKEVEALDVEGDDFEGVAPIDVKVCDDDEVELLDLEAREKRSCDNDIEGEGVVVIDTSNTEAVHSDEAEV